MGACGWAVVQLEYGEEMGPLHGMCGSEETELEVQRTIKRTELTAFLCLFRESYKRRKVSVSSQEREMLIHGYNFGKNCMVWQTGNLVEVEHVKAHRTKKEKTNMSQFDRFVTEATGRPMNWQK